MLRESLRAGARGLVWWSAGLLAYVALILAVWPSVRDNPELNRFMHDSPDALKAFTTFGGALDLATPAGYLGREMFSMIVPLIFLICGIGWAAAAIAGEEERGTLDLLLANPVSRRRVASEKLASVGLRLAVLGVVLWAALAAGAKAVGMAIGAGRLAEATAAAVLLALAFAAIAFLAGAAWGRRGRAIAAASVLALASYVLYGLAGFVDALRPLRWASPFAHYAAGDPLRHGVSPWHALVLAAVALAAAALSLTAFARRDLASPS